MSRSKTFCELSETIVKEVVAKKAVNNNEKTMEALKSARLKKLVYSNP